MTQDNSAVTVTEPVTTAQPEILHTTVVKTTKKGGSGKCVLIGCIVLLLCCVLTIGGGFLLVNFGGAAIVSSQTEPDPSLVRLSSISEASYELESINYSEDNYIEDTINNEFILKLTEKQFLAWMFNTFSVINDVNTFAVDFEKDNIIFEFNIGNVAEAMNEGADSTNYEGLKEAYGRIEVKVDSTGTKFDVTNVSMGNSIIDALIGPTISGYIEEELNKAFTGENTDPKAIKSFQIFKDQLVITFDTTNLDVEQGERGDIFENNFDLLD